MKLQLYNSNSSTKCTLIEEASGYTLRTNALDCWWGKDDISFAYDICSLPYGECSRIELTAVITSFEETESLGSAGIILRGALTPESAHVFYLIRRNAVLLTYRLDDGVNTQAIRTDKPDGIRLPAALKLVRRGNYVTASYKEAGSDTWEETGMISISLPVTCYYGIAAHSGSAQLPVTAVFRNLSVQIENTPPLPQRTKARPSAPSLLLDERFEAFSCRDWSGVTCANIAEVSMPDGSVRRVWFKDNIPGYHFAGNVRWTDYSFSAELMFPDSYRPEAANQVGFFVRQREPDQYGKFHYGIYLTGGDTISIRKCIAGNSYDVRAAASAPLSYLSEPGKWNTIRIDAFDNTVTVYWNGTLVLSYEDNGPVIAPFGRIGFMTHDACVYFGRFAVRELEDPLGGAFDNLIGGLYDQPAPDWFSYSYEDGEINSFETTMENATKY